MSGFLGRWFDHVINLALKKYMDLCGGTFRRFQKELSEDLSEETR
jgi:hypothetical protein